jgi:hypothetical protein
MFLLLASDRKLRCFAGRIPSPKKPQEMCIGRWPFEVQLGSHHSSSKRFRRIRVEDGDGKRKGLKSMMGARQGHTSHTATSRLPPAQSANDSLKSQAA